MKRSGSNLWCSATSMAPRRPIALSSAARAGRTVSGTFIAGLVAAGGSNSNGPWRGRYAQGQFLRTTRESSPKQRLVGVTLPGFLQRSNRGPVMLRWGLLLGAAAFGLAAPVLAQDADVAPTPVIKPAVTVAP